MKTIVIKEELKTFYGWSIRRGDVSYTPGHSIAYAKNINGDIVELHYQNDRCPGDVSLRPIHIDHTLTEIAYDLGQIVLTDWYTSPEDLRSLEVEIPKSDIPGIDDSTFVRLKTSGALRGFWFNYKGGYADIPSWAREYYSLYKDACRSAGKALWY